MSRIPHLPAVLLITCAPLTAQDTGAFQPATWKTTLDETKVRIAALSTHLESARASLILHARKRARDLLPRLTPELPKPRKHGYGLLPEVEKDPPLQKVRLYCNRYSIADLLKQGEPVWPAGMRLAGEAQSAPSRDKIARLIDEFENLRDRMKFLESQVSYHRYWQKAVPEYPEFFAERNKLLPLAEKLQALVQKGNDEVKAEDKVEIDKLRQQIGVQIAPFRKTIGLKIRKAADGTRILPVRVATDIEDEAFLATFKRAVAEAFNQAPAAQAARFRVDLSFVRIPAKELYRSAREVPARGAAIDEREHLGHFPTGALVLTTGGKSSHAYVSHYIQLGTRPTERRALAHEFGHLLGFSDGYLRGFTGDPKDPLGCTVVEWGGLQDDIMGSPAKGAVTAAMIRRLVETY